MNIAWEEGIAIIPAKSRSWRIPGKNIREFCGKPMLAYPIATALESGLFSRVLVSTEDEEIFRLAQEYGAIGWMRAPELCGDKYGPQDIAAEVLESIPAEHACVIHPCSPLMTARDLHAGFDMLTTRETCHYAFGIGRDPLRDAGAWYWGRRSAWLALEHMFGPYSAMIPIPDERVCDVNTQEDWDRCEKMYAQLAGQQ